MDTRGVEVAQKTAQKTRVGYSLLLAFFLAASAAIGGGFMSVMFLNGDVGGGGGASLGTPFTPNLGYRSTWAAPIMVGYASNTETILNADRAGTQLGYMDDRYSNDFNWTTGPAADAASKAPFAIALSRNELGGAQTTPVFKSNVLTFKYNPEFPSGPVPTTQTITLCIPDTTFVKNPNTYSSFDPVIYYFDKSGKPYSDALLQRVITCPPVPAKKVKQQFAP